MVSALFAGALIVVASLLLGAAIMVAAGRPRHSPVGPAAGLSALLVICGIAIKLPGHGLTAAIATGLALIAAIVVLERSRSPLGAVRYGALIAVVGTVLVVAIPFATSGRVGILGQGLVNDDMASHLLFTEWIDTREGPTPDLIEDGYPLGPHAVVSAASKVTGASLIEGFAGLTGAIALLTALTAYGALGGVREWLRGPAAVLGAMSYLGAAYLAQGAFKEPMLGLALLGFTLWLPLLRKSWEGLQPTYVSTLPDRGRGWLKSQGRLGIPGGVIAAGTIYNYSFPGLAWLVLALVAWGLIVAYRERGKREDSMQLRSRWRWARPTLIVAAAIPAVLALPELINMAKFVGFGAINPSGEGGNTGFGNLRQALNPLEALGIWPSSEFRITPANSSTPVLAFYLGGLLALAAFGHGLGRAVARREAAFPAALISCALGYLAALVAGSPYTSAKALAILAPIAMVVTLRGLLSADPLEGEDKKMAAWWPPKLVRPWVRVAVPALTVAFALAAAFSTLLPLRQSSVGPPENSEVLIDEIRPLVQGEDVLFLGRDNFISWELLGADDVFSPLLNHYDTEETSTLYRATPINGKFDWDNVPAEGVEGSKGLDDFDWVLTTNAALNSAAPPAFEPEVETEDFVLWKRQEGPGAPRRTLLEPLYPGASVDCEDSAKAGLAKLSGTATVLPRAPVIGKTWEPNDEPTDGQTATQELDLPPGSWAISMQYASTQELRIRAPGFDQTLPTNLLFRGPSPYYPVGAINVAGEGVAATGGTVPVRFEAAVAEPPFVGRLLGTEGRAYLGTIAATPLTGGPVEDLDAAANEAPRELVGLRRACGRYVDWYSVAPGTPDSALDGIEAPIVHPPQADE